MPLFFKDKPVHKGVKIIRTNPNAPCTVLEETVEKVVPVKGKWGILTKVDKVHDKKS
jgi:hypothetical protein